MITHSDGIRHSLVRELDQLRKHTMAEGVLLDESTLELLVRATRDINREILIVVNDRGHIEDIFVGNDSTASFETGGDRSDLSRRYVIHTHPGGSPFLSDEDISSALEEKLTAMIAVGVPDSGNEIHFGAALPYEENGRLVYHKGLVTGGLAALNELPVDANAGRVRKALRHSRPDAETTEDDTERAILLGIDDGGRDGIPVKDSMDELVSLVKTAGAEVLDSVIQSRPSADPSFYLGRGKITEISRKAQNLNANLIVANDELSAAQISSIETVCGCKTIDRTTVILDIFARHATTREGKLQVELAQQHYRLSHLRGMGLVLSRTGGGIGTRGPGEKKLETDRRHIQRQIDELKRQLQKTARTAELGARRRQRGRVRTVGLIGYTNSGKSTLFNRLTSSSVISADDLFVTLDTTIRKINPEYGNFLLSDTVGFIEKLPHDLVEAFKTTLAEVRNADLLLQIIDASDVNAGEKIRVTEQVISEIGAGRRECIRVYNKCDKLSENELAYLKHRAAHHGDCVISAKTGEGIDELIDTVKRTLAGMTRILTFFIPYSDSSALSSLHHLADVIDVKYRDDGTMATAVVSSDFPIHRFEKYFPENSEES